MTLTKRDVHKLAMLGAAARVEMLTQEINSIRKMFPDAFKATPTEHAPSKNAPKKGRRRGWKWSKKQRKAISVRMKKMWAPGGKMRDKK
jgi:hypothetical protein